MRPNQLRWEHTHTHITHKYLLQVLSYPCLVIVRILGLPFKVNRSILNPHTFVHNWIKRVDTRERWAYHVSRNSYILIFQLPLCSYSGVQSIATVNVNKLTQPHCNTLHDHSAQCDVQCTQLRVRWLLSVQVVTWRYTFAWKHNNKSTSPFMGVQTPTFGISTKLECVSEVLRLPSNTAQWLCLHDGRSVWSTTLGLPAVAL